MEKKKDSDYIKMVEEMEGLVDEGMYLYKALAKMKKKYKLDEEEGKKLWGLYIEYCHEKSVDEVEDERQQEPDKKDDFLGEDIDNMFDDSEN